MKRLNDQGKNIEINIASGMTLLQSCIRNMHLMPITLAEVGEENIIRKIGGKQEVKTHLENLGFVVGGAITVINAIGGNVIVNVKDSRIAVSKEMAQKIMV